MKNFSAFIEQLSPQPGIYQMLDEKGEILYIGKAKNLKKRVISYFNNTQKDLKTQSLIKQISQIEVTITHSENEAVLLECNLIKKHKPRYNVLLRDDKSYPYILITHDEPYPRIDIYRGQKKKNGRYFGPYPSALAVRETISLLQKLFKLRTCHDHYFKNRSRPCLLYQIGRCAGPCVHFISKEAYAQQIRLAALFLEGKNHELVKYLQQKMEACSHILDFEQAAHYRDQIARLRQIQEKQYVNVRKGRADIIGLSIKAGVVCIQLLSIRQGEISGNRAYFPSIPNHEINPEEVMNAFITQHYLYDKSHIESIPNIIVIDQELSDRQILEEVLRDQVKHIVKIITPLHGEKKKWLEMANNNAKQSLMNHLFDKTNIEERMHAFTEALDLSHLPKRIECFDVSHTQGEATVASCVVFNQEGPVKNDYRRFNITDITAGDDIAAMHQVILRRLKRLQKESAIIPDIILIDGGQTQLNAAMKVIDQLNIQATLIAVSKGPKRKPGYETLHFIDRLPLHLPADSLALHLIQQIRDEAHRFAIMGHRARRSKTRRHSLLEDIPGIGSKRRRELLRYFGGIQGVAHASLKELSKVPGISRPLAEKIFAIFHDTTL